MRLVARNGPAEVVSSGSGWSGKGSHTSVGPPEDEAGWYIGDAASGLGLASSCGG